MKIQYKIYKAFQVKIVFVLLRIVITIFNYMCFVIIDLNLDYKFKFFTNFFFLNLVDKFLSLKFATVLFSKKK